MNQASNHGSTSGSTLPTADFLRSFVRDYRTVGAVRETSRGVVQRICTLAGVERAHHVAEFGCGTGPITAEILRQMPEDGILWGYEIHEPFADHLRSVIDDDRFTLFEESAATIVEHRKQHDLLLFDAIISTIPFSYLTRTQTTVILRAVVDSMTDEGTFVALQYHPTYLRPLLRQHFDSVERELYLWNVPPANLLTARKPRRL